MTTTLKKCVSIFWIDLNTNEIFIFFNIKPSKEILGKLKMKKRFSWNKKYKGFPWIGENNEENLKLAQEITGTYNNHV